MDTNYYAETLSQLELLSASGSTVRIGYTVSNGKSGSTWEPMPAKDAIDYLTSMHDTLALCGLEFSSVYVERWGR